jgi:hypothetical protein
LSDLPHCKEKQEKNLIFLLKKRKTSSFFSVDHLKPRISKPKQQANTWVVACRLSLDLRNLDHSFLFLHMHQSADRTHVRMKHSLTIDMWNTGRF